LVTAVSEARILSALVDATAMHCHLNAVVTDGDSNVKMSAASIRKIGDSDAEEIVALPTSRLELSHQEAELHRNFNKSLEVVGLIHTPHIFFVDSAIPQVTPVVIVRRRGTRDEVARVAGPRRIITTDYLMET